MRIERNRHLTILITLFKSGDTYVSSQDLALKTMASIRTIKSDVSYLNNSLRYEQIAMIESKQSRGYRLVPLDSVKFSAFIEQLHIYQILFRYRTIEEMNRRICIIQNILAHETVKIDDVAEIMFLSRTAIAKDVSWAVRYLESYRLKVRTVPGKGLCLYGDERDKRDAMVDIYCSQYHDIELLYPSESFISLFGNENYEDVRHQMLKVIRESDLTISDLSTKQIATYLCLVPARIKDRKTIIFDETMKEVFLKSYEYKIAGEILKQDTISQLGITDENEVLNLTRLLIVNKDIDLRSHYSMHIQENSYKKAKGILKDIQIYFRDYRLFYSEIFVRYQKEMMAVILSILLQIEYGHIDSRHFITYADTGENKISPLAMEYTRLLVHYLEKACGYHIRRPDVISSLSSIFHHMLGKIPYDHKKLNLVVFSTEGRTTAELIREDLLEQWNNYIEKADVFNLYEMRKINFSDYDAALSSWDVAYYKYPLPLVSYKETDIAQSKTNLFKDLFIKCYDESLINRLCRISQIYEKVSMPDYMTLIRTLAQKYSDNSDKIVDKLVSRFNILSYYYPDSGISMIFMDYQDTQREILDIYLPTETVYWSTAMEIRCFVVVCIPPDLSLSDLQIENQMLHMLYRNRNYIYEMIDDKEKVLKELFISVLEKSV